MQVILKENIENLGRIGDLVQVRDGYARNYLLPRKLVVIANANNQAEVEHQKKILERKRQSLKLEVQEVAKKLEGHVCVLQRKVGEKDKLYGSVSAHDILESLSKSGFQIEKRTLHIGTPIKNLGDHKVTVKLETDIEVEIKVSVVKET